MNLMLFTAYQRKKLNVSRENNSKEKYSIKTLTDIISEISINEYNSYSQDKANYPFF